jgi:threonine synthase
VTTAEAVIESVEMRVVLTTASPDKFPKAVAEAKFRLLRCWVHP